MKRRGRPPEGKGEIRAVSFRGSLADIRALKLVAHKRGVIAGDLVRQAVDAYCGEEIERASRIFPVCHDHQNQRSFDKSNAESAAD